MRCIFTITLFLLIPGYSFSQTQKPCSSEEAKQFDFWLGEWDLTWNDTMHGTNRIEKLWGDCVLQENFNDPGRNYSGKSWTVYNSNYKTWQQTWVDSQGGYIVLTGNKSGDSITLTTAERTVPEKISPTRKIISRMVYHHITPTGFDWRWESSTDGGNLWKMAWLIHYKRKK
jgi:hypothetical protein